MKRAAFFALMCMMIQTLEAESAVASSKELTLQLSSLPEAKLGFTKRFLFPFLQGESPLTENNNINLALAAEITPVSLNGLAQAVWTPIAFFQFAAGARIGPGWNVGDRYGIGVNRPDSEGKSENAGSAFDGLLWKTHAGAVLQGDLAAFFPGPWHHLVLRTYHQINYQGYTAASAHEAWFFENDEGENVNGFNYYGNLLIGYQMPIFLSLVGLLAEADLYLNDTPNRRQWGDERMRWTFSSIFNFPVTSQFNIALLAQLRTARRFLEANYQDLHYRNRTIDSSRPLRLEFYRVAAVLTYRL
jgi:hypothetical protein